MTKHEGRIHDKAQSDDPDFRTWVNHPKNVARLQIIVVVLGIFVAIGFATVIARIAYLTLYVAEDSGSSTASAASPPPGVSVPPATVALEQSIELPPGAVVQNIQAMGNGSVMVHFQDTRGTGMMVVDANTGAVLKKWRFVPAAN